MATERSYQPLENEILKSFGTQIPSFNTASTPSFFSSASFLYTLAFVIIITTASFRYAYAGILRMQASEEGIRKSKEEFTRVTYGLLGVLGLWLILFTINKDMLTGDVTLSNLRTESDKTGNSNVVTKGVKATSPSGVSTSCENPNTVKSALTSGAGICGNTSCSLSGCLNNSQYKDLVKELAGPDWKLALILLCKESRGDPLAQSRNQNGTYDCGLMQINQVTACDASILEPRNNITEGVSLLRKKLKASANTAIYPTLRVDPKIGAVTAYNCCANGTIPNEASSQDNDSSGNPLGCKTSDGWPSIPKWACPINPGTSQFNMCGVKSYACDINACLNTTF